MPDRYGDAFIRLYSDLLVAKTLNGILKPIFISFNRIGTGMPEICRILTIRFKNKIDAV